MANPVEIPPIIDTATPDAALLLKAATAEVRRECGWHVTPILTETLTLNGSGGRELRIPSGRIRAVTEVLNDGTDVTADIEHSQAGVLRLATCWTHKLGGVQITLEHGWAEWEAADVAGVVAAIASRSTIREGVVAAQSVGGASVRYEVASLLQSERAIIQRYAVRS